MPNISSIFSSERFIVDLTRLKMRWCTLILLCGIAYVEALECGIGSSIDNGLKRAIVSCLRRNMTLNSIFDFTTLTSGESQSDTSKNNETARPSSNMNKTSKNRKKTNRIAREVKKKTRDQDITTTVEPDSETEMETEATTEDSSSPEENCIIQCVLSKLDLTDKNGYPEHQKIEDLLLKNAKGREMEDFLQDAADRCYQKVNNESTKEVCQFSSELVKCLADSGKSNCGDWPAGDISLFDS